MTDYRPERVLVAQACRILAVEGLVADILGHVSLRVGEDTMLIRARAADDGGLLLTRPSDVVLADFAGQPLEPLEGRQLPQELSIHGETLRHRPEVAAVVHAHPPDVVLCSIAELELGPIIGSFNIPAMRLAEQGVPTFGYYGLIRDQRRAGEMLAAMGEKRVVILRGHGVTAVGADISEAVMMALNVNALASMTAAVARLGRVAKPVPLDDREDLPDLGGAFNNGLIWRHHLAKLRHLGLAV